MAALSLILFSAQSSAETLEANIEKVGCHIDKNTCFVYIDKYIPSSCPSNDRSLRWNGDNPMNGRGAVSILLSAQTTGKLVTFGVNSCYDGFPTFQWLYMNN